MWELDCEESSAPKNWCFWTVVLEKTLESPLYCKEIHPTSPFWRRSVLGVHWKDWRWGWNSNILTTSYEELTHWKRLWCWEGLGAGREGDDRGWDGWMASPTQCTWVWVNSRSWWWTGRPGVLQFMGSQRVRHDWVTELNWTESWFKLHLGEGKSFTKEPFPEHSLGSIHRRDGSDGRRKGTAMKQKASKLKMLEIREKWFRKELVESKWKCWVFVVVWVSVFSMPHQLPSSGNLRVDHFLSRLYDSVNRNVWFSLVMHTNPSVSKRGICAIFVISVVYDFHPAQKLYPLFSEHLTLRYTLDSSWF